MSNLGLYQWFTTTAKKVGGPAKLIGMFISGGAIIGGAVGSVITNKYRDIKDKKELKTLGTYSVTKDAEIKKIKLVLKTGDQVTVLAADDDSILIIKNGDCFAEKVNDTFEESIDECVEALEKQLVKFKEKIRAK